MGAKRWRLTDLGVVQLRRAVGNEAVLCLLLEVSDHVVQGGHGHLQRTERHYLLFNCCGEMTSNSA